jgi:hypothetical protein
MSSLAPTKMQKKLGKQMEKSKNHYNLGLDVTFLHLFWVVIYHYRYPIVA